MAPRIIADMQKNVTLAVAAIASELSSLHRRVSEIEDSSAVLPATCAAALPSSDAGHVRCGLLAAPWCYFIDSCLGGRSASILASLRGM